METFGQRLKRLMAIHQPKKITQKELGAICKVSYQSVQKWQNDINQPDSTNLNLISKALGVSIDYLLNGEKTTSDFHRKGHIQAYDDVSELPKNDDIVFVKFARNLTAACGDGMINDEFIEDRPFPFSLNSLKKSGVCDPEKVIVGYADGDSNAPAIPHKAAIGIDTACTTIHHGKLYLITVEGKERIKQIIKLEEGRILLRSQNPDKTVYPDEIFDIDKMIEKQVVIRGRLFWVSWMDRI